MRAVRAATVAAVVAFGVLAGGVAQAQRGGGRFGGMMMGGGIQLLRRAEVQTELKLTDEQKSKINTLLEELREARRGLFQDLRDATPEERQKLMEKVQAEDTQRINAILNPDQQKRFKQISLQQQGPMAIASPEIATELKLTDEQKRKVQEIVAQMRESQRGLFQGGDREGVRERMEALRKDASEKITAVLTEEQKAKWKEMLGAPFSLGVLGA